MDRKKLALIHIVKRELRLSDAEYRRMLRQAAGVNSARDLDSAGFAALMRYFVRSRYYRDGPAAMSLRQRLFIRSLLAQLGWDQTHAAHFAQKYYHKSTIEQLDKKQASSMIEALKHMCAQQAERQEGAGHAFE